MTETVNNLPKATVNERNQRYLHLEQFFLIKQKLNFISRQTLYLGIAIFDTYWEKVRVSGDKPSLKTIVVAQRVATCLWIAWKFNEVNSIPIRKFLGSFSITDMKVQHLAEMESEIMQKIDFEIPLEFPYLELIDSFDHSIQDKTDSLPLVSQCLGFLKEGIMHSSDFSLCPDLGRHILTLYSARKFGDTRIKQVYALIKQKRQRITRKEVEAC